MSSSLETTTVIVTGASSGIGAATARLLAERGAAVVLVARRAERLDALAAEITAAGGRALAVPADVTERDGLAPAIRAARDAFGSVDVFVNNAGTARLGRLEDGAIDDWDTMIDSNLRALLHGLATVLPVFREQGHGHVVTTVSTAGLRIVPEMGVYAATKNAARAVMEALRTESTDGVVRTTEISPGYVRTELADGMADGHREQMQAGLAQFGLDPSAVARAIVFAIEQPRDVEIGSIVIRPTVQG